MKKNQKIIISQNVLYINELLFETDTIFWLFKPISRPTTEISTEKWSTFSEGCRLDTDNQWWLRNFPSLKTTMEKQHFLCMDVDYEGQAEVIKEGESRKGILTFVNADKFRFVEQFTRPNSKTIIPYPHRKSK